MIKGRAPFETAYLTSHTKREQISLWMDYSLRAGFSLATERKPVNITAAVWKTPLWLQNMYPSLKYFMNSAKSYTRGGY